MAVYCSIYSRGGDSISGYVDRSPVPNKDSGRKSAGGSSGVGANLIHPKLHLINLDLPSTHPSSTMSTKTPKPTYFHKGQALQRYDLLIASLLTNPRSAVHANSAAIQPVPRSPSASPAS